LAQHANLVVTFTPADTAATIQAAIDAVPKVIGSNVTVEFAFGSGTYTLNNKLDFRGFTGPGYVFIHGDLAEPGATSKHTTQNVILNFTGSGTNGIEINQCNCRLDVRNLRTITDDTYVGIVVDNNSNMELTC